MNGLAARLDHISALANKIQPDVIAKVGLPAPYTPHGNIMAKPVAQDVRNYIRSNAERIHL